MPQSARLSHVAPSEWVYSVCLDFLLQELGRETNTVGSKANDAPLAQDVVELKTELERIREQVQNVE